MKLCEIRGVSCHLHPVLALFLLTGFLAGQGELLLTAFFSLLLHETAHTWAASLRGVRVVRMDLSPVGALAQLDPGFETRPGDEAVIALAGPAASGFLWLTALAACQLCGRFAFQEGVRTAQRWADLNFGLMAFNLMPALPLDGGRVVRAWLSRRFGLRRATILAGTLGLLLCAALLAVGLGVTVCRQRFALPYAAAGASVALGAASCLRQSAALGVRAQLLRGAGVGLDGAVAVRRLAVDLRAGAAHVLGGLWQPGYYELVVLDRGVPVAVLSRDSLAGALSQGARTIADAVRMTGVAARLKR